MNILFIAMDYPPMTGGIANFSYEIAKRMLAEKGELVLVAPRVKDCGKFDAGAAIPVFRVTNVKLAREITLLFVVLYLVFKFKVDVIYNLTWYPSAAVSLFVNIFKRVPYTIQVHGTDYLEDRRTLLNKLKYNRFRAFIKRTVFDRAGVIFTRSNFIKDMLVSRGIHSSRIRVISGGVDTKRFIPGLDTRKLILKYGLEKKRVLLTVARLSGQKGHDVVINMMPRLLKNIPDIVYMIVGSGEEDGHLKSLVRKLGLEDTVIFTGYVDDPALPFYYNACDIFIMLSREDLKRDWVEGLGLVFLEANSCGRPVVGARTGGIADAVMDGKTGFLVDPENEEEIAAKITMLLEDRKLADLLGNNGRERIIRERLEWESVGKRFYDALASEACQTKAC